MKKILMGALTLLLVTGAAKAQDSTGRKHHKGQQIEQLHLTPDQKAKLTALRAAQKKEWSELKNQKAAATEANKKQRSELQQKHKAQIKAILTPEQQAQLEQARTAHRNNTKIKNKEQRKRIKDALGLSETQQVKMKALNKDFGAKKMGLHNNASLTEAQKKEELKALALQRRTEIKNMLTTEQQQKLETLRKEHRDKRGK